MNRDNAGTIASVETLALGVMLDGPVQQGWVLEALRRSLEVPGVRLTAIALLRGGVRDTSPAARLHRLLDGADQWLRCRDERLFAPADLTGQLAGPQIEVDIVRDRDGGYVASFNGDRQRFDIDELGSDTIRFRTEGLMESAKFLRDGERLYILHRGATIAVRDLTLAAPESAAAAGGDGKVRAAMNGRVVAVLVKPGEQVAAGQPVMTLEAMKMEHVHTAGVAGTVSAIDVAEGEQVTTGRIVVEIAAALA